MYELWKKIVLNLIMVNARNIIGILLMWTMCFIYTLEAASPVFPSATLDVVLPESLIVGGPVTSLNAIDTDGDIITYTLVSINPYYADNLFNVAVTGEITTTGTLDYESITSYVLVVRATSKGEVAEQTVNVNVINVNEAPEFPEIIFSIMADNMAEQGSYITRVSALDPDKTTDTRYSITDGNSVGHFSIGQTSGIITVSTGTTLNRTIISAYALTIQAADHGTPPKTGTTTLVIGICNGSDAFGFSRILTFIVIVVQLITIVGH